METLVLIAVVLVAALVVASGVWVGVVLIVTVTRIQRPASSPKDRTPENAGP